VTAILPFDEFTALLKREGEARYHDRHPYHLMMHSGQLSKSQLQEWVRNRYYYQSRIPIKDALIVAKSEDPAFRRMWLRRVRDQDGDTPATGGLDKWLALAAGVGLDPQAVARFDGVLPAVRFACDGYVELVRSRSLLEAVASSLTEFFAPNIMATRIEAWAKYYPWVSADSLAYFRTRVTRARMDSEDAVGFLQQHATTYEKQQQCLQALIRKTEVLWALLDALYGAYVQPKPA
jgi:pyrroloquinoline-quinone synthase